MSTPSHEIKYDLRFSVANKTYNDTKHGISSWSNRLIPGESITFWLTQKIMPDVKSIYCLWQTGLRNINSGPWNGLHQGLETWGLFGVGEE